MEKEMIFFNDLNPHSKPPLFLMKFKAIAIL